MPIVILIAFAFIIVGGALLVGYFIRPNKPSALKYTPYECGETPQGGAWSNFNVRFYVIALIFIIFDVEGALMFHLGWVLEIYLFKRLVCLAI
jgi:NADH-quinone oxidoreductase subunit A